MKILLLDIETAPNIVHVWGLWKQTVNLNQILASGYVMCWAAKWYGKDRVMFDSVHKSKPATMLKKIHALINEADCVVHYNGTSFDIPTLNKEFITQGLKPPAPYKQADLYLTAKRTFRFPSNKLEYIAKTLGLGEKTKHEGHQLWVKCMAGEDSAWKRMEEYNRNDVVLLEKVYDRMKPWIRNHLNHGTFGPGCTNCGSASLIRQGHARTQAGVYQRYQCQNCGSWVREAVNLLGQEARRAILRPVLN